MLWSVNHIEQYDGAFLAFKAGENGFQGFEGAVGDGDFFAGAKVAVDTFLVMRLGAQCFNELCGHGDGPVPEG